MEGLKDAGRLRQLGISWVHLGVLWTFAFAQPLFEVLSDAPEFFVARRNTGGDIVVFAFVLVLVPPSVLVAVEALFLWAPSVRRAIHLAFVALMTAAFALQVLADLFGLSAGWLIVLAVGVGLAIGAAYARTRAMKVILTVLGPAPLVFLVSFLFLSPVSKLVLPHSDAADARTGAGTGAPVVMVVFDEFSGALLMDRHGAIDPSRFPNFASFADDATWFRNATTVDDRTERAVPALLTGRVPELKTLAIAADYPGSLFTLLGDRYDFHVIEPATDLCPSRLCGEEVRPAGESRLRSLVSDLSVVSLHLLLPEDLADGLPAIDRTFADFRGQGRDRPTSTSPALLPHGISPPMPYGTGLTPSKRSSSDSAAGAPPNPRLHPRSPSASPLAVPAGRR